MTPPIGRPNPHAIAVTVIAFTFLQLDADQHDQLTIPYELSNVGFLKWNTDVRAIYCKEPFTQGLIRCWWRHADRIAAFICIYWSYCDPGVFRLSPEQLHCHSR